MWSEWLLSALPPVPSYGALAEAWREPSDEKRPTSQRSRYGILERQQKSLERRTSLARPTVHTYEEARHVVEDLGILPLSSFMPGHPSLGSITESTAWHTGTDTDPWLWRDHFAAEGVAAYGRFLGDKPLLISRELFPLMRGVLAAPETVEERSAAGRLARPALLRPCFDRSAKLHRSCHLGYRSTAERARQQEWLEQHLLHAG